MLRFHLMSQQFVNYMISEAHFCAPTQFAVGILVVAPTILWHEDMPGLPLQGGNHRVPCRVGVGMLRIESGPLE